MPIPAAATVTDKIAGERRVDRGKLKAIRKHQAKLKEESHKDSAGSFMYEVLAAISPEITTCQPREVLDALVAHPAQHRVLSKFVIEMHRQANTNIQPGRSDDQQEEAAGPAANATAPDETAPEATVGDAGSEAGSAAVDNV